MVPIVVSAKDLAAEEGAIGPLMDSEPSAALSFFTAKSLEAFCIMREDDCAPTDHANPKESRVSIKEYSNANIKDSIVPSRIKGEDEENSKVNYSKNNAEYCHH